MQTTHTTLRRHTIRSAALAGALLAGCAAATAPIEGALAGPRVVEGHKMAFIFRMPKPVGMRNILRYKYRTEDGTARAGRGDYVAKEGTVIFKYRQDWKTIHVQTLRDDDHREGDETFSVRLYDGKMLGLGSRLLPLPRGYPKEMKVTGLIRGF